MADHYELVYVGQKTIEVVKELTKCRFNDLTSQHKVIIRSAFWMQQHDFEDVCSAQFIQRFEQFIAEGPNPIPQPEFLLAPPLSNGVSMLKFNEDEISMVVLGQSDLSDCTLIKMGVPENRPEYSYDREFISACRKLINAMHFLKISGNHFIELEELLGHFNPGQDGGEHSMTCKIVRHLHSLTPNELWGKAVPEEHERPIAVMWEARKDGALKYLCQVQYVGV